MSLLHITAGKTLPSRCAPLPLPHTLTMTPTPRTGRSVSPCIYTVDGPRRPARVRAGATVRDRAGDDETTRKAADPIDRPARVRGVLLALHRAPTHATVEARY